MDAHHPRGGTGVPRLAFGAGRQQLSFPDGHGGGAGASAPLHRPPEGDERAAEVRAPPLFDSQGGLQRALFCLQGQGHRPLHGVVVEPHAGLQGHVSVLPAQGVLPRPLGRAAGDRHGAGAPALLHQHLPVVEAGASLPHGRPQRRDQHAARQCQLDGGAPSLGVDAAVRARHLQAVADLLRGPVRHGLLRQRARVPGDGRLQPLARGDDAHPGSLGRQSAHG